MGELFVSLRSFRDKAPDIKYEAPTQIFVIEFHDLNSICVYVFDCRHISSIISN